MSEETKESTSKEIPSNDVLFNEIHHMSKTINSIDKSLKNAIDRFVTKDEFATFKENMELKVKLASPYNKLISGVIFGVIMIVVTALMALIIKA